MNIFEKLERTDLYTPVELDIIQYLLANKEHVATMSIQELARETYTSNAAIIRLCKKLGESGFKEFKVTFARDLEKHRLQQKSVNMNYPFGDSQTSGDIACRIADLMIASVHTCYQNMPVHDLERAARLLWKAEHIFIYATGDSEIRGHSFANKLTKIGRFPIDTNTFQELTTYASYATSKDCALFITYSASSHLYVRSAQILKSAGVPIVTITAKPETILARLSDLVLSFPDYENELDSIATFYSQTSLEYMLSTLYSLMFSFQFQKNTRNKRKMDENRVHSKD